MENLARFAVLATLGATCAVGGMIASAFATDAWMTEEAMRTAFIGKTLDGHYVNGERWTETYTPNGRLDYSESVRKGVGYWYFRRHVFCTFYDPGQGLNGGCFTAVQPSANCYEFYLASLAEREADRDSSPGPLGKWVARAWRRGGALDLRSKTHRVARVGLCFCEVRGRPARPPGATLLSSAPCTALPPSRSRPLARLTAKEPSTCEATPMV